MCCCVLQRFGVCCSTFWFVFVCCSVLQCAPWKDCGKWFAWRTVSLCCSVLQCVAVCQWTLERVGVAIRMARAYIYVLQCVTVCCSVLQRVAMCTFEGVRAAICLARATNTSTTLQAMRYTVCSTRHKRSCNSSSVMADNAGCHCGACTMCDIMDSCLTWLIYMWEDWFTCDVLIYTWRDLSSMIWLGHLWYDSTLDATAAPALQM